MKKIVIAGTTIEYNTLEELKDIMAVMGMTASASAPAKGKAKKPTGKKAQPKAEKVEFTKKDGTKVMVSPAQAAAWDKYRNRSHKTLDEVRALKAEITEAGREYVKAHPGCTRKEAAANGCKNITKSGLYELKRELGVR